jgi:hypothetical protein
MTNSEGDNDEFTLLTTTGAPDYRVDGYTQAFTDGTPISEAKAAVLQLLPPDTKTTSYFIQHDSAGSTCIFMDIQSAMLGQWFSGKKIGDLQGVMGIELSTQNPSSGTIYYDSRNVESAVVGLAPLDHSTNC